MTLVDYPSSSSDSEQEPDQQQDQLRPTTSGTRELKRKQSDAFQDEKETEDSTSALPPLPISFHDLYAISVRGSTHDDPSLHGGRKRAVPHVEGNWPSHVYLEWYPSSAEYSLLSKVVDHVNITSEIHSLLHSDLGTPRPLHISLSQSLNLATEQRSQFLSTLKSKIYNHASSASLNWRGRHLKHEVRPHERQIGPFVTRPLTLHWVPNEAANRWFLVLRVKRPPADELNRLLRACNSAARAFGQGELYAEKTEVPAKRYKESKSRSGDQAVQAGTTPKAAEDFTDFFHMSIAWALEKPRQDLLLEPRSPGETGIETDLTLVLAEVQKLQIQLNAVKVKTGNEIHSIELSDVIDIKGKGILG